jgi:hypothetical protein
MGCPLAAAVFTLTLHAALAKTHANLQSFDPAANVSAYLDDINIFTTHVNLAKALQLVTCNLQALGLQVNTSKTECWINPTTVPYAANYLGIKRTQRPIVLKTTAEPIPLTRDNPSNPGECEHHAPEHQRLVHKRSKAATRLNKLHEQGLSTHVAQALWRTGTASDSTFTARTIGIDVTTATTLDKITIALFEKWLQTPLTDRDIILLFTSMKEGGMGFTATTHIKDTGLIASWLQNAPAILQHMRKPDFATLLSELPKTSLQLQTAIRNVDPAIWSTLSTITHESSPTRHQQKTLTNLVRKHHQVMLKNTMTAEEMSIHLSTSGVGAGAWLHAPVEDVIPLSNEHFKIAANMRLKKPQTPQPTHCHRHTDTRTCNHHVCPQLHHALNCPFGPYRSARHNAVRDTIAALIQRITGQEPLKEQQLPTQIDSNHPDETNMGRSDITWFCATHPVHMDCMITSAFTQATVAGNYASSITAGYACKIGEQHKLRKYAPTPVTPIVLEAHGRVGEETLNFLHKLVNTLPEAERTTTYHYCLQQISTTLQRYNARTIEAHLLHHTSPQTVTASAAHNQSA